MRCQEMTQFEWGNYYLTFETPITIFTGYLLEEE